MRVFLVGSLLFLAASCVREAGRVEPAPQSAAPPSAASSNPIVDSPTQIASDDRSPFSVGDRVSCNWKSGGTFYDGKVVGLRDNGRIFVQYDDGDQEETSPSLCGMTGGSGPVIVGAYRVGDRVSCNWRSGGRYYDGRVGELRGGGRLFVQYDDGDSEETTPALCRALGGPSSPTASFHVGDRVSCNWLGKGAFYEGIIGELRARGRVFVQYDDGDTEETSFQMCRPSNATTTTLPGKKFRAGDRVSCNWKGGGAFYEGKVQRVLASSRLFIQYDDGDQEETSAGMCKASSTPTLKTGGPFKKGDRVSCNWQSGGTFYDGKVADLRAGGRIFIQYDDGDTEETAPNLCRSVGKTGKPSGPLRAGDRVACNWLSQGTFYSGRVAELRAGGRIFIQYDDGDQEETRPSLCRRL
jgi:hypothetical protein